MLTVEVGGQIVPDTYICSFGYSDFHNLIGFISKRCQIMFVKKVSRLVKPFLANLLSIRSSKNSFINSHRIGRTVASL